MPWERNHRNSSTLFPARSSPRNEWPIVYRPAMVKQCSNTLRPMFSEWPSATNGSLNWKTIKWPLFTNIQKPNSGNLWLCLCSNSCDVFYNTYCGRDLKKSDITVCCTLQINHCLSDFNTFWALSKKTLPTRNRKQDLRSLAARYVAKRWSWSILCRPVGLDYLHGNRNLLGRHNWPCFWSKWLSMFFCVSNGAQETCAPDHENNSIIQLYGRIKHDKEQM